MLTKFVILASLLSVAQAYSGMATSYIRKGGDMDDTGENMCEFKHSEIPTAYKTMFAAVPEAHWDDYANCGKCIKCTGAKGTIYAMIIDQCPTAKGSAGCGPEDVDFSEEAAEACTGEGWGEEPIKWDIVNCPSSPFGGSGNTIKSVTSDDVEEDDEPSPAPKPREEEDDAQEEDTPKTVSNTCTGTKNLKYVGPAMITKYGVDDAGECCDMCKENDRCKAWCFTPKGGRCKLKGTIPRTPRSVSDGSISGVMRR